MSTETTKRLTARQRARKALQREQETQKRREQALASVLNGRDERDQIKHRLGTALARPIHPGDQHKRGERAPASVLNGLDERDKINARIGTALADLIDLGDNRTSAGELAGLTAREVTGFLRATEDSSHTAEDDETQTNTADES